MLFSQRQKLENEYYKWLEKNKNVKPCAFSLISFLDMNGNLVEKEEKSNFQNLHIAFEITAHPAIQNKIRAQKNRTPCGVLFSFTKR